MIQLLHKVPLTHLFISDLWWYEIAKNGVFSNKCQTYYRLVIVYFTLSFIYLLDCSSLFSFTNNIQKVTLKFLLQRILNANNVFLRSFHLFLALSLDHFPERWSLPLGLIAFQTQITFQFLLFWVRRFHFFAR